jgi:hypothetical protein
MTSVHLEESIVNNVELFEFFPGIQSYDIISTLQFLGMIKYWRGKHIILKKEDVINDYLERWDQFQLLSQIFHFHGKVMRLM